MNKKILIILFLGMFLFSFNFISAESIGIFKQGDTINITNYCRDGGCSGIDLISIKYPNGITEVINEPMTMNGQEGFYEWSNTEVLGTYYFKTTGSNGVTNEDSFEVTPTGFSGDFTLFFVIGFLLFYGLTFYGIKMENEWVSLIGCFGLLIMGMYTSFYGIGDYKNDISNIFSYVTIAIGLGIGFEALRKITNY
jgi:hypothetical protein